MECNTAGRRIGKAGTAELATGFCRQLRGGQFPGKRQAMGARAQGIGVQVVEFRCTRIETVDVAGQPHVALKPIVEGMGLDWNGQIQRLKRDAVLSTCMCVTKVQVGGQGRDVATLRRSGERSVNPGCEPTSFQKRTRFAQLPPKISASRTSSSTKPAPSVTPSKPTTVNRAREKRILGRRGGSLCRGLHYTEFRVHNNYSHMFRDLLKRPLNSLGAPAFIAGMVCRNSANGAGGAELNPEPGLRWPCPEKSFALA